MIPSLICLIVSMLISTCYSYEISIGPNATDDSRYHLGKMLAEIGCEVAPSVTNVTINLYSANHTVTKMNLKFKDINTNKKLLLFIETHKDGETILNFIDYNIKYFAFFNRSPEFSTNYLKINLDELKPAGYPLLDCTSFSSGQYLAKSQQINNLVGPTNKQYPFTEAFIKYKTPKGCGSYCFAYNPFNLEAHVIGLRMNVSCNEKDSPIFLC